MCVGAKGQTLRNPSRIMQKMWRAASRAPGREATHRHMPTHRGNARDTSVLGPAWVKNRCRNAQRFTPSAEEPDTFIHMLPPHIIYKRLRILTGLEPLHMSKMPSLRASMTFM